jgi:hypothetical protein
MISDWMLVQGDRAFLSRIDGKLGLALLPTYQESHVFAGAFFTISFSVKTHQTFKWN